ncbi:MAG: DUF5320 family protein [Pseudomonadota bacterium]
MGRCMGGTAQDAGDSGNMGWNAPGYAQGRGTGRGMGRKMGMGWQGCQRPRFGMGMGMARGSQALPATKETLTFRAQQLELELEAIKNELKQMGNQ